MKVDSYIESLLRKWGAMYFSEDLSYPHRCAYLGAWRSKEDKGAENDLDLPEVERLAEFMPLYLTTMKIHVLRIRYRKKIRHKRKAARLLNISEKRYRECFNSAIRIIQERF